MPIPETPRPTPQARGPEPAPREDGVTSRELLGESGVLRIRHGPDTYLLRRTRTGKLILTK